MRILGVCFSFSVSGEGGPPPMSSNVCLSYHRVSVICAICFGPHYRQCGTQPRGPQWKGYGSRRKELSPPAGALLAPTSTDTVFGKRWWGQYAMVPKPQYHVSRVCMSRETCGCGLRPTSQSVAGTRKNSVAGESGPLCDRPSRCSARVGLDPHPPSLVAPCSQLPRPASSVHATGRDAP